MASTIKANAALLSSLIAYYRLEGNVTDSHGSNNGTAEKTISMVAGALRNCIAFDGNGDPQDAIGACQVLNLGQLLAGVNSFSISYWANTNSVSAFQQHVTLASWNGSAMHAQSRLYSQQPAGASGNVDFAYWGATGGYVEVYAPLTNGSWIHWTITLDYNAGSGITTLSIYKNGYLVGSNTNSIGIAKTGTIPLLVGGMPWDYFGTNQRLHQANGKFDEIAIAARAWTAAEVRFLYHTGLPVHYDEVLAESLVAIGATAMEGVQNLGQLEPSCVFEPVTSFEAVAGPVQRQISLSWTNPVHPDFLKVIVRRSDVSFPPSPSSGDLVYEGSNEATIDTDLDASKTYYYSIFAFDSYGTYSVAVTQSCKPEQVPVTDFEGVSGIRKIEMTWTNPVCPEFVGVMLRRSEITYPATPTDGIQVYNGTDADYTDDGLDNAKTYYYSIFAYITGFEYAEAATGSWSTLIIPNVTDVVAISSIVVRVTYDREMKHTSSSNPDDSLNPTNYAITGGDVPIVVSDVDIVQSNPTIVDLIVNEMKNEESYHLIVSNVKSLESEQNLDNNDGDFEGIGIPPQVEIRPVDSKNGWVKIQYSEIMGSSVLVLGNYSINPELNILGVSSVTSTIFKLVTEPQTSGVDYVLTVSLDVKDQVGNAISPENRTVLFRGKRIDYSESTVFDYFSSAGSNRRIGPVEGVGIVTVEVPSDKPE